MSSSNIPPAGTWAIDQAHSTIEFVVRHMMVSKVKGRFSEFEGSIVVDENGAHSVNTTIQLASIDTRDEKRDEHLRSPDFFDVDNNKTITFTSTGVAPAGDGWNLTGDLTIKGITKSVTLELEYTGTGKNPWGAEVAGFEAHTEISRADFGLEWNAALETGGVLVGDSIKINLDIEATKA